MTRLVANFAGFAAGAALLVTAGAASADSRLFSARSTDAGINVVGARIAGKTLTIAGQGGSVTFFRIDNPGGSVSCQNRITFLGTGGKTATVDADICANGAEVTVGFATATPPPAAANPTPSRPPASAGAGTTVPRPPATPAAPRTDGQVVVTIATDDPNVGIEQIFIAGRPVAINRRIGNAVEILVVPGAGGLECRRDLGLVLDDGRRLAREADICANGNRVVLTLTGGGSGSSAGSGSSGGTASAPPAGPPASSAPRSWGPPRTSVPVAQAAEWMFVSSRDNGSLSFAVKGTDASEFTAVCAPKSNEVTVALGRSAPSVRPGSDVGVAFSAGAYTASYTAIGSDTSGASNISNPLITLKTSDPLWPALIRESEVTIRIGQAAPYVLPLKGSAAEARKFLAYCSPPVATPPPTASQPDDRGPPPFGAPPGFAPPPGFGLPGGPRDSGAIRADSGTRFFCADGGQLRVIFDDDNGRVLVSDNGDMMMALRRVQSRFGARYVSDGYEFIGRAEDITWRRPGGGRVVCGPG